MWGEGAAQLNTALDHSRGNFRLAPRVGVFLLLEKGINSRQSVLLNRILQPARLVPEPQLKNRSPTPRLKVVMPKSAFYAVKKGRVPGIYSTWDECSAQVKGQPTN